MTYPDAGPPEKYYPPGSIFPVEMLSTLYVNEQ